MELPPAPLSGLYYSVNDRSLFCPKRQRGMVEDIIAELVAMHDDNGVEEHIVDGYKVRVSKETKAKFNELMAKIENGFDMFTGEKK